jgi:hypothetical protein
MKRTLPIALLIGCAVLLASCTSFAYLFSDDYLQAGIRIATDPGSVGNMRAVNTWSTEFPTVYSAHDVGKWAANRLARQGRHDVLVLVEIISSPLTDIHQSQNMWRISVYPIQRDEGAAQGLHALLAPGAREAGHLDLVVRDRGTRSLEHGG